MRLDEALTKVFERHPELVKWTADDAWCMCHLVSHRLVKYLRLLGVSCYECRCDTINPSYYDKMHPSWQIHNNQYAELIHHIVVFVPDENLIVDLTFRQFDVDAPAILVESIDDYLQRFQNIKKMAWYSGILYS